MPTNKWIRKILIKLSDIIPENGWLNRKILDYLYPDDLEIIFSSKENTLMTKEDRIKEVLKVLDLPEEKQLTWAALNNNIIQIDNWEWDDANNIVIPIEINWRIFADLAFRMRDKMKKGKSAIKFYTAFRKVAKKVQGRFLNSDDRLLLFIIYNAQPIHWILTAIIAEILAENKTPE